MTATMPASGPTTDTSTRQTAPTSDASFSSDGSAVDRNLGWRQNLVFGIQHVLMMYVGCVSVPLTIGAALGLDQATVAMLVNADLLVAGVITLIQSLGAGRFAGARMPVVGGAAFAQVATMISISNTYGLPAIWGCMLAGGVIGLALAWPFSKLLKYFPPLVTGAVLLVLGISLIGVPGGLILGDEGTDSYARPLYIGIAAIVVVIAFGLSALARGMVAKASLLIAAVAGDIWSKFPDWAQTLLSDGVVLAALAAFFLNLLFNHTRIAEKARASRHESQPEETPLFL
ncbi:solute carrier family 23 protein [Corynebacterium variabile]|uniref:solute carrier family 23 protein n=1 Tax=Corynebacterium variabile TaxID=1727 RepID=UPI0028A6B572|nr:solute carrier family 23 protein [Corynebacterium variabile]